MKRFQISLLLLYVAFNLIGQTNKPTVEAERTPFEWNFRKYRIGGYAEILYQHIDYNPNRVKAMKYQENYSLRTVGIPRAIVAFDYKFRDDIILSSELEVEWGGTGAAMELEYEEAGEYEMEVEKAGEVVLEQFHITKRFLPEFNVRAGHMIVPVGLTNAHHEPIFFFGSVRPEGETTILPSTWHETGISVLGYIKKFRYEVMLVNGLDPNGFTSSYWIAKGKQGIFEKNIMTSPAIAGRIEYSGVKGLRIGASGYFCNTAKNASKPEKMSGINAPVTIGTADIQYMNKNFVARANFVYGNLESSQRVSTINRGISKATGFTRTPVAKNAMTYSIEMGYNIFSFFPSLKTPLVPFVRYEYYNSAEKVVATMAPMPINKRELFTVGLNYKLLPNMVVKVDYAMRRFPEYRNYRGENTFGIALAYTGWFANK